MTRFQKLMPEPGGFQLQSNTLHNCIVLLTDIKEGTPALKPPILSDGSSYVMAEAPQSTLAEVGSAIDLIYSISAGPGTFADREEPADSRASLILVSPRTLTSVPTIYQSVSQNGGGESQPAGTSRA